MIAMCQAEPPAQFAFRVVEASGANVWYAAVVEQGKAEAIAREIVTVANELQPDAAVLERVGSPKEFSESIAAATCQVWVGFGFDRFDGADWSQLDRARSRLERRSLQGSEVDSSIVVLILSAEAFAALQASAPNIASWIGGSVFALERDEKLSATAREARLEELRRWGIMTDEEVVRHATAGTLPTDPYFAEWLVLLDRGDLLGNR